MLVVEFGGGSLTVLFPEISLDDGKWSDRVGVLVVCRRREKAMSDLRWNHQSFNRSSVDISPLVVGYPTPEDEESARFRDVMNWEEPRFMFTGDSRLMIRLMRPETCRMVYPSAAVKRSVRGVGPMLPLSNSYMGPFSSLELPPPPGRVVVEGVSSALRRFRKNRRRQNQRKKASMLRPTMPPITPPATATVEWILLLLGEGVPLTAPSTEGGEPDAGTAEIAVEEVPVWVLGSRAGGNVLISGISPSEVALGTVAPCCVACVCLRTSVCASAVEAASLSGEPVWLNAESVPGNICNVEGGGTSSVDMAMLVVVAGGS
jgi:hypothetical protein